MEYFLKLEKVIKIFDFFLTYSKMLNKRYINVLNDLFSQRTIHFVTNSLMTKTIRYELISSFLDPFFVIVGGEGLLNEVFVYQSMILMISF